MLHWFHNMRAIPRQIKILLIQFTPGGAAGMLYMFTNRLHRMVNMYSKY